MKVYKRDSFRAGGGLEREDVQRFVYPIYGKTQSSAKKGYRFLSCWGTDEYDDGEMVLDELNNPEHVNDYLANYAKAGMRKVYVDKDELDFELPAGYSPEDEYWIKVKLVYEPGDGDASKAGSTVITFPCCGPDYGNLIYFTAGYMLVPCRDGLFRFCSDYEILQVDRYKV